MRPSPGRVPSWPSGLAWSPLAVEGPMARSVADVAFFLAAIAGPDSRSPISIEQPGSRFASPLGRDFKGVRVAWWKNLGGLPVDRRVKDVVNAQRRVFESLGCAVEEAEPDFSGADETFKTLRFWQQYMATVNNPDRLRHRDLIKDTVLFEIDRGQKLTGADVGLAEMKRGEIYERVRQFMDRYEFFVLPVNQVPPFDVKTPYPTEIEGVKMTTYIDWMKSCYYISLVGNPAMSVPAGFTPEGLPVGIQIVGRHHDDWGLLQMAYAFEQASGLPKRLPQVAV
jgi:amidase